ncbi:hypothetical protein GJ496_008017 [Pomphorhynchus laevis]|nr:hypothetical protein GJ496_008017 [Pomphorhynchus laevis]
MSDISKSAKINLNNNYLRQLNDLNKMFSGIKYLRLDYNLIESIEPHFVQSKFVRLLSLKGNRIRNFHLNSNTLVQLQYLDLSNNILSNVKIQDISDFELRLTGNPNDFELECYTQLMDLRFNRLQSHQVAQKKISTAILLLDYNLLDDLQFLSAKQYLNKLKSLSCSHNLIRTINDDFFASAINLEKLDLSYNCIDYLPNDFLNSKHTISHVNLSFNMITAVSPGSFNNMFGLQDLSLFGNPITEIPYGFLYLSSQLKSL